jgi:hypothetical protein
MRSLARRVECDGERELHSHPPLAIGMGSVCGGGRHAERHTNVEKRHAGSKKRHTETAQRHMNVGSVTPASCAYHNSGNRPRGGSHDGAECVLVHTPAVTGIAANGPGRAYR